MAEEITDAEKEEISQIFGNLMGKEFVKLFNEVKRVNEDNKRIGDARYEVTQTKLDTIINELRKVNNKCL